MSNINLNELRDRAYKTACEHGFHDKELSNEHFFCLIISRLGKAVEADRKGKRADRESFKSSYENEEPHDDANFKYCFEKYIKDTLPDELSEVVIRLLDLAGLRGISLESASEDINSEYIDDIAYMYSKFSFAEAIYIISVIPFEYYSDFSTAVNYMIFSIFAFSKHLDIDLLWHIEQKQRYNELIPKLNGKKY